MADVKISELTALTSPDGAEELVVNDGGTTKKITITNATSASLPKAGGTMTGVIAGFESTGIDDNATSTAITIDASENVGIGTSSPTSPLHITGSGHTALTITGGASSDAQIRFGDSANTTIGMINYDNSANALKFVVNGSTAARIDSSGNVGIGVEPEASGSNYNVLQIGQGGSLMAPTATEDMYVGSNVYRNSSNTNSYIVTEKASIYEQYNGEHYFNVAPSGSADAAISFAQGMKISNAGIVTKPLQPAFCVTADGSQNNFAINTQVTVTLNNEIIDKNNDFSSNTFTAPVTGSYQLQFSFRVQNVQQSANYYQIKIATSNRSYLASFWTTRFSNNLDFWTFGQSVLADMDAGDTAYITINQSGGSAATDIHNESYFSGFLVG